jgi:hypothetical protein
MCPLCPHTIFYDEGSRGGLGTLGRIFFETKFKNIYLQITSTIYLQNINIIFLTFSFKKNTSQRPEAPARSLIVKNRAGTQGTHLGHMFVSHDYEICTSDWFMCKHLRYRIESIFRISDRIWLNLNPIRSLNPTTPRFRLIPDPIVTDLTILSVSKLFIFSLWSLWLARFHQKKTVPHDRVSLDPPTSSHDPVWFLSALTIPADSCLTQISGDIFTAMPSCILSTATPSHPWMVRTTLFGRDVG